MIDWDYERSRCWIQSPSTPSAPLPQPVTADRLPQMIAQQHARLQDGAPPNMPTPVALPQPAKELEYKPDKRCCSICDARKVCHVCGEQTLLACSDCRINFSVSVYVCQRSQCRNEHERRCFVRGIRLPQRPLPQPEGWQPIETAPKDGTRLLLARKQVMSGELIVASGYWNSGGVFHMPHWSTATSMYDPTHWMPIPPAPLVTDKENP